jgi:hydroxypyruvate reductase
MNDTRSTLIELFGAGVAAVEPARVVIESLSGDTGQPPAAILAVGKAACGMAWGATEVFGHRPGLVVSHEPAPVPPGMTHLVAGHPLPDDRSVAAGIAALELAASLDIDERLLVLVSGGASALLEVPADGLTVAELAALTDQLLRSGASINEINAVRSAASHIKAGGIRRATRADITTLAISDVVGDDPHAIGSGPTVLPVGPSQAGDVLSIYADRVEVPPALGKAVASPEPTSHRAGSDDFRVIASGTTAAQAVAEAATHVGIQARPSSLPLQGDTATAARVVVEACRSAGPGLDIYTGETTLEVSGSGTGGRCQHAALLAAAEIAGNPEIIFLAAGTDGRDGPTDAAGAVVDGRSVERAREAGHTVAAHVASFDSHSWLAASGDLITTGPTGTNVGDIWMCWNRG